MMIIILPQLPLNHLLKRDEQQKSSLNALIKEQERSKVPKAVQKRRIILLFRRLPHQITINITETTTKFFTN